MSKKFVTLVLSLVLVYTIVAPAMAVSETVVEEDTFVWEGKEYVVTVTEDADGQRITQVSDNKNEEEYTAVTEGDVITVTSNINGTVNEESVVIPEAVPETRAVGKRESGYRDYYYYWDNSTLNTYGIY
ncbi:MAG: hypothetical protein ACI4PV_06225 [Butyricicoccus sp.]